MHMNMKRLFALSLFGYFPFSSTLAEDFLKKHGNQQLIEDQQWGSKQLQQLLESGWDSGFEKNDILPIEDRGKEFDPNLIGDKELKDFVGFSDKKKKFEGTEKLFLFSREILENPEENVGIVSTHSREVPEEQNLVDCQEAGTYQLAFSQKRVIEVLPPVKSEVKHCKGHYNVSGERFFWKSSAEDALEKVKEQFSQDKTLDSF